MIFLGCSPRLERPAEQVFLNRQACPGTFGPLALSVLQDDKFPDDNPASLDQPQTGPYRTRRCRGALIPDASHELHPAEVPAEARPGKAR
jgi:hypothetical protein